MQNLHEGTLVFSYSEGGLIIASVGYAFKSRLNRLEQKLASLATDPSEESVVPEATIDISVWKARRPAIDSIDRAVARSSRSIRSIR